MPGRGRAVLALLAAAVLAGCAVTGGRADPEPGQMASRVITPELWAGKVISTTGNLPSVDARADGGRLSIRGPLSVRNPVDGTAVAAYERVAVQADGTRRELITVTQDGAGLGRVLDASAGLPDRRFAGDVVFPLGLWHQGEKRSFEATEFGLLGPMARNVELEIVDIDFVFGDVPHSLSYRLTVRDEAGRVLSCAESVYSPGRGLVDYQGRSYWPPAEACPACPCPDATHS
jgi:hypothetical protein